MKLLNCADLHLGASPHLGRTPYGPESRLADQETAWLRVCDTAIDEQVDALIFAGDGFHRRRPTPAEILTFRHGLDRLCMHGIPVFALDGNHDVISADQPSALQIFEGELELYRTPAVRQFEGIYLCFLPWTPPAQLVAKHGGGDRDQLHRTAAELLLDTARGLRAQCAGGAPAILVAHWSVGSAVTPTGAYTDDFREPCLPLADLCSIGFDAVVLGHIHRPQQIARLAGEGDAPVFYCGSPGVVDWGEAGCDHGVWLLETSATRVESWRFVPIADRPFRTLDVDFLDGQDFSMLLERYGPFDPDSDENIVRDAVIRVRYRATPEQAKHIDHAAVRQALLDVGAWHVTGILPEIIRPERARAHGVDETLTPWAAFERWLESQDTDTLAVDLIRARAAEYLDRAGVA